MIITSMSRIGKSERYKVFYDSTFLTLESETIYKNNLSVGCEIDEQKLFEIQFDSEKITAFDRAISYMSKGLKTKKQIRDYLYSKGYCKAVYDYVIAKLEEYKYIDDNMYARNYLETYSSQKGKKLLKFELLQKGVKGDELEKALEEKEFDEYQIVLSLAKKRTKGVRDFDDKFKQKLYRYLASRGFDSADIMRALKEVKCGAQDEDWN